jgi:hypothetical protein
MWEAKKAAMWEAKKANNNQNQSRELLPDLKDTCLKC